MMEAEVEKWKRDYILLLQSCITIPTGDIMDGMQVNLYGGNIVSFKSCNGCESLWAVLYSLHGGGLEKPNLWCYKFIDSAHCVNNGHDLRTVWQLSHQTSCCSADFVLSSICKQN